MKRILIATVLSFATVASASAMTSPTTLSNPAKAMAESVLPNTSFDNLTATQATIIEGIFSGGQDLADWQFRQLVTAALAR